MTGRNPVLAVTVLVFAAGVVAPLLVLATKASSLAGGVAIAVVVTAAVLMRPD